jgi:hypothetical protein
MKKSDYITRADSSFNKSIEVKNYTIRAVIAIIGLMIVIIGLPLIMSTLL